MHRDGAARRQLKHGNPSGDPSRAPRCGATTRRHTACLLPGTRLQGHVRHREGRRPHVRGKFCQRALRRARGCGQCRGHQPYDVSADGRRFLINAPVENTGSAPITVVVNWQSALGARERR
jgi:hypothetical protein